MSGSGTPLAGPHGAGVNGTASENGLAAPSATASPSVHKIRAPPHVPSPAAATAKSPGGGSSGSSSIWDVVRKGIAATRQTASRAKADSALSPEFLALRDAVKLTKSGASDIEKDAEAVRKAATELAAAMQKLGATVTRVCAEKGAAGSEAAGTPSRSRLSEMATAAAAGLEASARLCSDVAEVCSDTVTRIRADVHSRTDEARALKASAYSAVVDTGDGIDRAVKSALGGRGLAAERALLVSMGTSATGAAGGGGAPSVPHKVAETQAAAVAVMRHAEAAFETIVHRLARNVDSAVHALHGRATAHAITFGELVSASPEAARDASNVNTLVAARGADAVASDAASLTVVPARTVNVADAAPMLAGETALLRVDDVCDDRTGAKGALLITAYRLRWFPHTLAQDDDVSITALKRLKSQFDLCCAPHPQMRDAAPDASPPLQAPTPAASAATPPMTDRRRRVASLAASAMAERIAAAASSAVSSLAASAMMGDVVYHRQQYLCMPLLSIARMQVVDGPRGALVLRTTDLRAVSFSFAAASMDANACVEAMNPYVWVKQPTFPLAHRVAGDVDGWRLYTCSGEYERMLARSYADGQAAARWRVYTGNDLFALCSTYPRAFVLPACVSDESIARASKYRSKKRLPVCVWFRDRVSLSRSAQPLPGILNTRSSADEALIAALRNPAPVGGAAAAAAATEGTASTVGTWKRCSVSLSAAVDPIAHSQLLDPDAAAVTTALAALVTPAAAADGGDAQLAILDARPRMNALGNRGKGGGTENANNYAGCTLEFLNIDNIHVVRDALGTLRGELLRTAARMTTQGGLASPAGAALNSTGTLAGSAAATAIMSPAGTVRGRGTVPALLRSMSMVSSAPVGARTSRTSTGLESPSARPSLITDQLAEIDSALEEVLGAEAAAAAAQAPVDMEAIEGTHSDDDGVCDIVDDEDVDSDDDDDAADADSDAGSDTAATREGNTATNVAREIGAVEMTVTPPLVPARTDVAALPSATPAATVPAADPPSPAFASALFVVGAAAVRSSRDSGSSTSRSAADASNGGMSGIMSAGRALMKFASRAPAKSTGLVRDDASTRGGVDVDADAVVVAGASPLRADAPSSKSRGAAGSAAPARTPAHGRDASKTVSEAEMRSARTAKPSSDASSPAWLRLLSILLTGGVRVAVSLHRGIPVFVHCSDGWDRTAALTSLGQLLLDPYYRTLEGFCILVEKEWCSFGHRFARRCGTGGSGANRASADDDQRAPIFPQWCDAVWQVWRQFPSAFQFNERLIVAIAEHAYSGRFGTFLYDCERDREEALVRAATTSMWTYVLSGEHRADFTNPAYAPAVSEDGVNLHLLLPSANADSLLVWPYWIAKWT